MPYYLVALGTLELPSSTFGQTLAKADPASRVPQS